MLDEVINTIISHLSYLEETVLSLNYSSYIAVFPLVAIFWPLCLTLLLAATSFSTWIFWLFTSILVGIVQLIYVSYQFLMIGFDIGILSVLKTFALLRSYIRYYTIKSGFSKKRDDPNHKYNKRGRRREWRAKLNEATSYKEFLKVEIQEPSPIVRAMKKDKDRKSLLSVVRKKKVTFGNDSKDSTKSENGIDGMKKVQSCLQLQHPKLDLAQATSPRRSSSIMNMPDLLKDESSDDENDLYFEKELGNLGFMLVNTTNRLKENRTLATMSRDKRLKAMDIQKSRGENNGIVEKSKDLVDEYESCASALKFLLSGVVKRNHLSVNDLLIGDAKSVMECGMHKLSEGARSVIVGYHEEVERCLEWIASSKPVGYNNAREFVTSSPDFGEGDEKYLTSVATRAGSASPPPPPRSIHCRPVDAELSDRINLIRKLKHNMGRTALMLSGGGAQAMYHLGTIKALCESKMYDDIEVISGTSGGSITAAMCAIRNREELLKDVCVKTVSTDFLGTGEQKKKNIRWFPRVIDMGTYWLKHKLLVDSAEFKKCCDFYFGDITFEEAFERTGKHICITVSASRAESGGAQRLLLNHISTPHVTLASAVAASCALPGVMAPAKLRIKNSEGQQELFEVDGVEWIDGSVQADLPFKRISTLFNVSSYIVCQTNFHVLPFLHKAHHPNMKSVYWKVFQTCEWDIRNRALNLSRLGLFPKMFGQDISKVFKQKYHGDLTLVPKFTTLQVFGLKSLVNPDVADMEIYLQNGQSTAWPYLGVIKEMLRLERAIDKCMNRLLDQKRNITDSDDEWDEIESITSATQSNRSRIMLGSRREIELLKYKLSQLENENSELKRQLDLVIPISHKVITVNTSTYDKENALRKRK